MHKILRFAALLFILIACSSENEVVETGLEQMLAKKGIKRETIDYLILKGDEASEAGDLKITMPNTIDTIWGSISSSRPYDLWHASGYRPLEFYTKGNSDKPVITLLVNESDACHIDSSERYRCLGLHEYLMRTRKMAKEMKQFPESDQGLYP